MKKRNPRNLDPEAESLAEWRKTNFIGSFKMG